MSGAVKRDEWLLQFGERLQTNAAMRTMAEWERERVAVLNGPAPKDRPELMALVRCEVLRAFCVNGRRVEPGAVVELPRYEAKSMQAIGRVRLLD